MKKDKTIYALKLVLPIIVIGTLTGALTGGAVTLYRFAAHEVIALSEKLYELMRQSPWIIAIALPLLFCIAFALHHIYKKLPTLKGGGISEAMGLIAGLFTFKWLRTLIGTVTLSLSNFFLAVPLGNEGPSVLIGASVGKASCAVFGKKGDVWSRYSIAGGACSGFAAATGAPITAMIFCLEEMHRRLSPMILLISLVSVAACRAVTELLCPVFNINVALFKDVNLPSVSISEIWLPVVIGAFLGGFSIVFLWLYRRINSFLNKTLSRVGSTYKIFAVFTVTLLLGVYSYSFVSTGHELMKELLIYHPFSLFIILLLVFRSLLTLSANANGITGGMFLPTLALSALASALLAHGLIALGVSETYYALIVVLGIIAGMSGIMNMPFTAILFALEAFYCTNNLLSVVIAAGISFAITVLFRSKSINELALESRIERERHGKTPKSVECDFVIKKGAFAIGKEIVDILWPAGLYILSVTKPEGKKEIHSALLCEGDVLHVTYKTWDEETTKKELFAIIGRR